MCRCPVAPLPESTPWDTNLPLNAKIGHLQWRQWNEAGSLAGKPASCRNGWTAVLIFGCTYFVRKRRTVEGTGSSFSFVVCILISKYLIFKFLFSVLEQWEQFVAFLHYFGPTLESNFHFFYLFANLNLKSWKHLWKSPLDVRAYILKAEKLNYFVCQFGYFDKKILLD